MIPPTFRLHRYIAMRRSLGYDLSFAERVLRKFAEFADRESADHITVDLFLRWKKQYGSANSYTWSRRLSMVRVFAGWLQAFDPRTEVPPPVSLLKIQSEPDFESSSENRHRIDVLR